MDDYNVSVLSEAKNEYSLRLVSILYPLILEGIKSILKEAWELCMTNDEEEKYLMTFQNFLSRVTKWNQTIIDEETKRISVKSNCAYLEDLLTCVHITQLKILTSIRVSQRQKKIELDIPKLSDFIHKVYIKSARKFYTSVYLFEQKIPPLEYQKNMRECESICKECILNVIRDNMPVEHILRAYMDESVEEEIIEEVISAHMVDASDVKIEEKMTGTTELSDSSNNVENIIKKTDTAPKLVDKTEKTSSEDKSMAVAAAVPPEAAKKEKSMIKVETPVAKTLPMPAPAATPAPATPPAPPAPVAVSVAAPSASPAPPPATAVATPPSPSKAALTFNNVDRHYDGNTKKEELVSAPKDISTLEKISSIRNAQRKADEDEDEENLKIGDSLDIDLGIQVLGDSKPSAKAPLDESVFADIETL